MYEALTRDGQGPPAPETRDLPASLPQKDPVRGNPQAKVTIHEWSDFQCPFCARVEPTVAHLLKEYGPRVKLVWHDLPLPMHPDAPRAAQAAREALAQRGDKGFWALHDAMFDHQGELGRDAIDGYARTLGLDMARWKAANCFAFEREALSKSVTAPSVKNHVNMEPTRLVVRGTPASCAIFATPSATAAETCSSCG